MRKTKIICTIGPASDSEEMLEQLCCAGMNVARLNFSHGIHEEHKLRIDRIKKVREMLGLPIAILLDTKGPEFRIGTFKDGKIELEEGAEFVFTTDDIIGDKDRVSVSYKDLQKEMNPGDRILVNNGLSIFEVKEVKGNDIICNVINGGTLSNKKSMSFPNKVLRQVYLSEQDKEDLLFGIQNDIDFVAASFVSNKQDILDIRNFLDENGGEDINLIAKIENRSGVDHIDEICEVADGIMVARGDLGVEIPFVEVPPVQKYLIKKCRLLGKRVITATEMLESMCSSPRPTRAEISDVANAVYDGSSAVMLSGETAAGKYPAEAVRSMAEICEYTESTIDYSSRFMKNDFHIKNIIDAISHATCAMAIDVHSKAIVVNSISGRTARMVSRFRCPCDIVGTTTNAKVWRQLNLSWGVVPVLFEEYESIDVMFFQGMRMAEKLLDLQSGDTVVLTGGKIGKNNGNTNTIKVESVKR